MSFVADLHLHSKYSRATSPKSDLENFSKWAKIKGIDLLSTGDWTHPAWLKELKEKLKPAGEGLFHLRDGHPEEQSDEGSRRIPEGHGIPRSARNDVRFILGTELSCIYKKNGAVRKIHLLVYVPSFKSAEKISQELEERDCNLKSDGRPILGLDAEELCKIILDVDSQALIIAAHIFTPWFSLYGSRSGFDSLKECFGEMTPHIFAIETGLSADPEACWQLSDLDNLSIISNSDAHSPSKLGREVTIFDCQMSYKGIYGAIKGLGSEKRGVLRSAQDDRIVKTLEFFPQEGKYHFDGHRKCDVRLSPNESEKIKNICPKCKKPLTLGVMHRVLELRDKNKSQLKKTKEKRPPFKELVPLPEIIADSLDFGVKTKTVQKVYQFLIKNFKNEFDILLNADLNDLKWAADPVIIEGIRRVRQGKLHIKPGYDGEYGEVKIFTDQEREKFKKQRKLL